MYVNFFTKSDYFLKSWFNVHKLDIRLDPITRPGLIQIFQQIMPNTGKLVI